MSVVEEKPRMIAIDMDGTLVHPGGTITPLNQAALIRAREAGARIVIATGRRHHYAMEVLRKAALHPDDVVLSSNGTVARTVGGTLIFRNTMQLETARWLCDALGEFRNAFVLTFDLFGDHGEDLPGSLVLEELDVLHGSIFNWMDANARWIRRVARVEESLPQGDVPFEEAALPIQAMLCGPIERMARAEAMLTAAHDGRLSLYRTEYPARDLCILDILPVGSSKGTGLQRLLQRDGLATSQLMAIGDNWNDMPMLELARWPTVMGNAPEALRTLAAERGWPMTANHDEGGVAEAIGAHFPATNPS